MNVPDQSEDQSHTQFSQSQSDAALSVEQAIKTRLSCRRYLDKPVSRETVEKMLEIARYAPSGTNIQPWKVHVTMGETRRRLSAALTEAFLSGPEEEREYQYYPTDWFEPYLGRRRACGWGLYGALGIGKGEREKTRDQHAKNFDFFGAPVGLIFSMDKRLNTGSWLDYGMFLQSVMIAARGLGLHTCAQAAFCGFHSTIREVLGIPDSDHIICGMSLGYGDMSAPENIWRTEREPVSSFTTWMIEP
ncbi:MAG: nitroreductase [Gammaproteobacteria bacterium]|nr:nitroreductase [Gammaproteobacteria bacterium]